MEQAGNPGLSSALRLPGLVALEGLGGLYATGLPPLPGCRQAPGLPALPHGLEGRFKYNNFVNKVD